MTDQQVVAQRSSEHADDEHGTFCDVIASTEAPVQQAVLALPRHLLASLLALVRDQQRDPLLLRAGRDELRQIEMVLANVHTNGDSSAKSPRDATRVHRIKLLADFFDAVASGEKPFELRYDDRGYRCGDTLVLEEYTRKGGYTGREITRVVTYLLCGPIFGLERGWVAMGIATPDDAIAHCSRERRVHAD